MATVNAVVYDQFKREDGTFHVQIKVFHKDVRRFIETNQYVTARQLDEKLKIKDKHILKSLDDTLTDYRKTIGDLAPKLDFFTCDDLKTYLVNKDKEVDFIAFCAQHIASLRKAKRDGTADNHRAVRNSLIDYFKKQSVSILEINSGMLFAYEKWLQTDRTMVRVNQLGKEVTTTEKGMQTGGIYSHMRDLRTLFNEARKIYNNEDIGVVKIKHYPFKVYKIGAPPKTKKRNISAEQVNKIKKCAVEPESRAELAKDLFMPIQNAINFHVEEEVLAAHIRQVWETVSPKKQGNYFARVYAIAGNPEAIKDINVSNHLKNFFKDGILTCLRPNEWDEQRDAVIAAIPEGNRILLLFDQDLKLAGGRFVDDDIRGEDLILETKQLGVADRVILTLFTHTVPDHAAELPERQRICSAIGDLSEEDFFVLTKKRLDKQDEFTDGVKKACLNTYCEQIKSNTLAIVREAQNRTVDRIKAFDTYEFDQAVFKSSFTEGVWEPETLLRMTDTIFKDEVRRLMLDQEYVTKTNDIITAARKISSITVKLQNVKADHTEKFKIRHQELYESPEILNPLRRPIDNGDMFKINEGARKNKRYILIAQECDLMVRSEGDKRGKRGANMAILAEITVVSKDKVLNEQITTYQKQIDKKKFGNHFFADRYQLNYFELGTDKVGVVDFKNTLMVDLNILDLAVFDLTGNARLDLANPNYSAAYHNAAWQSRYEIIAQEYTRIADELDLTYAALEVMTDEGRRTSLKAKINRVFSFINLAGVVMNYGNRKFDFGVERTGRLRLPKSKHLLDRYYLHLSRFAEQHDFAEEV